MLSSLPALKIAIQSCLLGLVLGWSLLLTVMSIHSGGFWELPMFISSLCIFHLLEFFVTAAYNPTKVTADSFLLNNRKGYTLAQLLSVVEAIIEGYYVCPKMKHNYPLVVTAGAVMMIVGQTIRTTAMIKAASNFNHHIESDKKDAHILVKDGIYRIMRHPSYFGFFYWSLGTQLLLVNPISFIAFACILWDFFNKRIKYEEGYLIKFFGLDYQKYKSHTHTLIPFIR